jgi:hypothetical protein
MCENPLSPEMKAALAVDFDRPVDLANRFTADRLRLELELTPFSQTEPIGLSRRSLYPSAITARLLAELPTTENQIVRELA